MSLLSHIGWHIFLSVQKQITTVSITNTLLENTEILTWWLCNCCRHCLQELGSRLSPQPSSTDWCSRQVTVVKTCHYRATTVCQEEDIFVRRCSLISINSRWSVTFICLCLPLLLISKQSPLHGIHCISGCWPDLLAGLTVVYLVLEISYCLWWLSLGFHTWHMLCHQ